MYQSTRKFQLFRHSQTGQVLRLRRFADGYGMYSDAPISLESLEKHCWEPIEKSHYVGYANRPIPKTRAGKMNRTIEAAALLLLIFAAGLMGAYWATQQQQQNHTTEHVQ